PADVLPHLFEPLTQADRSLARSQGGLGLGLSVVKGLVERHGGQVTAVSEGPGKGAEFTIGLPLIREPEALSAPPPRPPSPPSRLRVLVIEDNKDAAHSLDMLLRVLGHEPRVAYTGTDGVAAALEFNPDVVISDIGLPGLDGYAVARELRLRPETAR